MTASDSVYLLRFGRCVDTRPPKIRLSTIRNMLVLCHFTSLMCLLNFVIVDRTWKLNCTSGHGLCWSHRAQVFVSVFGGDVLDDACPEIFCCSC